MPGTGSPVEWCVHVFRFRVAYLSLDSSEQLRLPTPLLVGEGESPRERERGGGNGREGGREGGRERERDGGREARGRGKREREEREREERERERERPGGSRHLGASNSEMHYASDHNYFRIRIIIFKCYIIHNPE